MVNEPVFVVGTGRCGSTVLSKCLSLHPSLLFIDEPRFFIEIVYNYYKGLISKEEGISKINMYPDGSGKEPMKFFRRLKEHYSEKITNDEFNAIYKATTESLESLLDDMDNWGKECAYEKLNEYMKEIISITFHYFSGECWLIKEPFLAPYISWISKVFKKSRFVHIIRNPFDVISSRIDGGFQKNFNDAFEIWYKRLDSILKFQIENPSKIKTVYFEKLIRQPKEELNAIILFLNLEFSLEMDRFPEILLSDKSNISRSIGKFKLTEIEIINEAIEDIARRYANTRNNDFNADWFKNKYSDYQLNRI